MRDGLYKVEFRTPLGSGAGVVHLDGGRLWGGDSGIAYLGSYTTDDGDFSAEVQTRRHTQSGGVSVFGQDNVNIKLQGKGSGDRATLNGSAAAAPGVTFQAVLTRIAD